MRYSCKQLCREKGMLCCLDNIDKYKEANSLCPKAWTKDKQLVIDNCSKIIKE